MNSRDAILWLDLETTGTDELSDPIIEVGAVLTDNSPEFREISYFEAVVKVADPYEALRRMQPEVVQMHVRNGLVEALLLRDGYGSLAAVEENLLIWLGNELQQTGPRVPLGGSGVSHFDRRFIKAQMPALDRALTYWAYDIGAVRRFLRLYGVVHSDETTARSAVKDHRALADTREHIAEARFYATLLREHKQAFDAAGVDAIAANA